MARQKRTNSWRASIGQLGTRSLRGIPVAIVVFGGLILHTVLRIFEYPFLGSRRPLTQYVTQVVCKTSLFLLGISITVEGFP